MCTSLDILPVAWADKALGDEIRMRRYQMIIAILLATIVLAGISGQLSSSLSSGQAGTLLRRAAALLDHGGSPGAGNPNLSREEVSLLREPYVKRIHEPAVQLAALEDIQSHLEGRFPWAWQGRMNATIGAVFPEDREELVSMYGRLSRYDTWLKSEWAALMGKPDRHELLWKKRREIFGREADFIWAGELKSAGVLGNLDEIDKEKGFTITGKLTAFENEIRKAYGGDTDAYMDTRRQDLLEKFFTMPGVQAELKAMDHLTRRETLMIVRRAFGMDEETLARWEKLDMIRDRRWENGMAYMEERTRIIGAFQGEGRELRIRNLRERYFGAEAPVIAGEEQAGYFRFRAGRIHGLN
jgi:hypothetical protein